GDVVVDGDAVRRALNLSSAGSVAVNHLAIEHGAVSGASGLVSGAGAEIVSSVTISLSEVSFVGNAATGSGTATVWGGAAGVHALRVPGVPAGGRGRDGGRSRSGRRGARRPRRSRGGDAAARLHALATGNAELGGAVGGRLRGRAARRRRGRARRPAP